MTVNDTLPPPQFAIGERVYWFCAHDEDVKDGYIESVDWCIEEYPAESEAPPITVDEWRYLVRESGGRAFSMRGPDLLRWMDTCVYPTNGSDQ